MKQKYLITILPETQEVSIREYTELDKDEFAFVCEEVHDAAEFRRAMAAGAESLVPIVRRPNMYPRQDFSIKIAQGIIALLADDSGMTSREIYIEDVDVFEASLTDMDSRVAYDGADGAPVDPASEKNDHSGNED